MAKQPDPTSIIANTGAKFVPSIALPRPTQPEPQSEPQGGLIAVLRRGATALTKWVTPTKAEPARLPDFIPLQVVLKPDSRDRGFTVASTVEHWKKGTANAQIPQQEYLLNWLRQNRQIKLEAAKTPSGQDVLQFNVPHWEDHAAIRKRLTIYHTGAIEKVIYSPEAAQPARPDAPQGRSVSTPTRRM